MPREERTRQTSTERFDPIAHIVLEPLTGPAPSKANIRPGAPKPPRPQNAWILYRAWALNGLLEKQPELRGKPQSQISKLLGQQWSNETADIRKHFEHQANLQKEKHAQEYPDYVFRPQKKEDKEREREEKKKERARVRETEKLKKEIAKALRSGHVSQNVTGIEEGGTGEDTYASAESDLHKFAIYTFDDMGPSPPMSLCPSPEDIPSELPEYDGAEDEVMIVAPEIYVPGNDDQMNVASSSKITLDISSAETSPEDNFLVATPWRFSGPVPAKVADEGNQSPSALSLSQRFQSFLQRSFPSFDPDTPTNHLAIPSGNLVLGPGFIHTGASSGPSRTQVPVQVWNPDDPPTQPPNHTSETNPMLSSAGPSGDEDPMLIEGEQALGITGLSERTMRPDDGRVIVAGHTTNGMPSMVTDDSDESSNPSPTESTTLISPDIALSFDFARMPQDDFMSSNDGMFDDITLSDAMFISPHWQNEGSYGIESMENSGSKTSGLQESNFRNTLASLPMMSADSEPQLSQSFEVGKVSTGMIDIDDIMHSTDSPKQRDRNWLPRTLHEPSA